MSACTILKVKKLLNASSTLPPVLKAASKSTVEMETVNTSRAICERMENSGLDFPPSKDISPSFEAQYLCIDTDLAHVYYPYVQGDVDIVSTSYFQLGHSQKLWYCSGCLFKESYLHCGKSIFSFFSFF